MDMTPIKNTPLYAIEVPVDATDIRIHFDNILYYNCGSVEEKIKLPPQEDYLILGTVTKDEISFDPNDYLEFKSERRLGIRFITEYKNYNGSKKLYTAEQSFRSRLEANGLYFVNPVQPDNRDNSFYVGLGMDTNQEWRYWESKLITGMLLLVEKIKN